MLKLNKVRAGYGDLQVLHEVGLEVESREIVCLIGANGAGKTTIMKTIMGLVRAQHGEVEFSGQRLDTLPAHKVPGCGIGLVPEGRMIFPEMTVHENLEVGSLGSVAKASRRETIEYVFDLFPKLKDRRNQGAGTLSGGEQQMLAIGRGLMSRPKMLLLDEPSLGLAPQLVELIFERLAHIANEGMTILLAEQNVVDALKFSTKAYVLEQGKITISGSAEALMRDDRVREAFLGI
ncbi:MAG: ABC transporter ATP-binding protein [Polaromonas sp.]|nr:ABC transporter ATP-binding protein [Polaromonas sp.]